MAGASVAMLASVLFENPLVAAGCTVALLPVSSILEHLDSFEFLKPYLITNYLDAWSHAFEGKLQFSDFHGALACVVGYCLIPYMIGAVIFWRKDVTS